MAKTIPEKELALKYALQNAVFYNGRANAGAVMGKILAEQPGLRAKASELGKEVAAVVRDVNKLKPEEQRRKLESIDDSMLERKEKVQALLPPLEGAVMGKVVTRFAPAPSGPLHLMHVLRALGLSYEYARKYKGKFILRFEDTDPKKVDKDAYEWIKQDMKSLGFDWDRAVLESEHMDDYYSIAERLISKGAFYVCSCDPDKFRQMKVNMRDCAHRSQSAKDNLKLWKDMLKGREGLAVRMKTDMADPNPALRDPPMLRVANEKHALTGTKYHVWPLYNFANVVEDHMQAITHVFRGKEHEHNTAVQERLYDALGWKPPVTINFGMLKLSGRGAHDSKLSWPARHGVTVQGGSSMAGGKLHKRDIREMLASGKIAGWDDPSLPTIRALLRRGYQPQAIRQAVFACGLSKTDITFNIDSLNAENRKLIDKEANRYMVVFEPVRVEVAGLKEKKAKMQLHPDFPKRGQRSVPVDNERIYVNASDFHEFIGKVVRLKGLCNIKLGAHTDFIGNEPKAELQKLHWVSEPNIKVILRRPEGSEEGLGEPDIQKAKSGSIIQMERVGFGRVDSVAKGVVTVFWAHK